MKRILAALAIAALGGCGVETASTAATAAAIKKTMEQAKEKIGQAMELQQQRANSATESADK